jgi:O-antigen/teichoic acid export membrane protein
MISELYAKGRTDEFQRFLTLAAWGIFLVTLPIAIGLIVMGTWLLGLFGHEFVAGYPALVTLVIGQAANALIGPVGFLALMTGNQREATWIFGTGAMLNVILNLILIPTFGLIGAAAATAIANGVWKLSMMVFVWKRLHVNPTVFPSRTARS